MVVDLNFFDFVFSVSFFSEFAAPVFWFLVCLLFGGVSGC